VPRDRPRFVVSDIARIALLYQFVAAVNTRDQEALLALFAEDATWTSDGGGQMVAARRVVSGLEPALLELVKLRASQIDGCTFCIDMHTEDARAIGESVQWLYALSAWPEAPFYTDRERAALAWTDAATLVADRHVPDEVYAHVRQQFSEQELVTLTMMVRVPVSTRRVCWHVCGVRMKRDHWGRSSCGGWTPLTQYSH
jgi:AhpD family alkylhydroperoxidase